MGGRGPGLLGEGDGRFNFRLGVSGVWFLVSATRVWMIGWLARWFVDAIIAG